MVPYVDLFIPYQTAVCLKTDHLTIICIHQYMHVMELYVVHNHGHMLCITEWDGVLYTIQQICTQNTSVHSTGP